MLRINISCNAEKELGKAFVNMFYLTIIAIFVTGPLVGNIANNFSKFIYFALLALFFLVIGLWLITHADKREERKAKNIKQTEVKK